MQVIDIHLNNVSSNSTNGEVKNQDLFSKVKRQT